MRSIRIGKDIIIRWKVTTNGEDKSLNGRKLKLVLHHSFVPEKEIPFSIDQSENNKIVTIIRGADQKSTGIYRLTLWENYGLAGQTVVDYCNAFKLVNTTCEEGGEDVEGLDTETVELEGSDIETGIPGADGMSAYELYIKHNPDSELTEEEYAKAPIEAADRANELADNPPKIVKVEGVAYWAFWDEEVQDYVVSGSPAQGPQGEPGIGAEDAVRFSTQSLTTEQQAQARVNIGAVSEKYVNDQVGAEQTRAEGQESAIRSEFASADAANLGSAKEFTTNAVATHNTSDTAHADIRTLLASCTGLPTYDPATYKLTFQTNNGQQLVVDLPIEKMDLRYNAETQSIEFDNGDGSVSSIPVSEFITEYAGSNGTEIVVTIGAGNVIQASIVGNSIAWEKLTLALQQKINDKADTTYVNNQIGVETSDRKAADAVLQGEIDGKLSIETYNADKSTFATKAEIGDINSILDEINGEVI